MGLEKVWLWVKEPSCSDDLVGVEVVLLSEFCEWELVFVAGNPVPKGGHGYLCLESSAHCSNCHIQGVALVVVSESCEDELLRVGCFGELTVRKALVASSA